MGGRGGKWGRFSRGFESRAHRVCWYLGYEISEVDRVGVMGDRFLVWEMKNMTLLCRRTDQAGREAGFAGMRVLKVWFGTCYI